MCNPECCWVDEYLSYADVKYASPLPPKTEEASFASEGCDPWDVPAGQGGACTRCVGNA